MSVESDLKARLVADATVNGLIAGRCYPGVLPQSPSYPALTFFRVSATRLYNFRGTASRVTARFQIDCWAATHIQARALADAVRASLHAIVGTMGSTSIGYVRLDNELDVYEDAVKEFRVILDFIIDYVET